MTATASTEDAAAVASRLAARFEEEGVDYAVGGALALAAHGVPRMTADADMSVYLGERGLDAVFDALERGGCLFSREHARAEVDRMSLFCVRCGLVVVDVFVAFHSHHAAALTRRVHLPGFDGPPIWFLSAEDLAIYKLVLDREKDRIDLERLFAARCASLDVPYIRHWIGAITPEGDPRRATLDELVRRFAGRGGGDQ